MFVDANGRPLEQRDYTASTGVGIQISANGKMLWVCIDGVNILRIGTPSIEVQDDRIHHQGEDENPGRE